MDTTIISAEEAAEYGEFKRSRREAEIALLLKKAVVDASRRETDRYLLKNACDTAKKLGVHGVLVSPVNVVAARKFLEASACIVVCRIGGTGESLPAVKRAEAKRAMRQGARELYLSPCYSALAGGNGAYVRREVKKVGRRLKNCALCVSLDDRELGEDDVALGVRAAKEAKAGGGPAHSARAHGGRGQTQRPLLRGGERRTAAHRRQGGGDARLHPRMHGDRRRAVRHARRLRPAGKRRRPRGGGRGRLLKSASKKGEGRARRRAHCENFLKTPEKRFEVSRKYCIIDG